MTFDALLGVLGKPLDPMRLPEEVVGVLGWS